MRTSESLSKIFTALALAQAEFNVAKKDSSNPFFKSNYADFESVVRASRPMLAKNGLSFVQLSELRNDTWILITRICHISGEWIEGEYPLAPTKNDPQGFGAAQTYGRRYALQAALGIVTSDNDDDAESMMKRGQDDGAGKPASRADIIKMLNRLQGIGVSETEVLRFFNLKNNAELTYANLDTLLEVGSSIHIKKARKEDIFKPAGGK